MRIGDHFECGYAREALHRLAVETSGYGYRRMTKQLHREGVRVNTKKIRRLMREEHLLYRPKKRFVVTTTASSMPTWPKA